MILYITFTSPRCVLLMEESVRGEARLPFLAWCPESSDLSLTEYLEMMMKLLPKFKPMYTEDEPLSPIQQLYVWVPQLWPQFPFHARSYDAQDRALFIRKELLKILKSTLKQDVTIAVAKQLLCEKGLQPPCCTEDVFVSFLRKCHACLMRQLPILDWEYTDDYELPH